ncbi:Abi family protein [Glutamicibacter sp. NPDC087583]|uniref:Abi family protein n=1 Tax=Glutamicibacter sp. NPDC087583 TaxID=3363995 RepID=UPI0037F71C85
MHPNKSKYQTWVQTWLTVERFNTYLRASGNDAQRAFDLYQWNTALNAAFLHDFAHMEVALRNALHRQLATLVTPSLSWMASQVALTTFPPLPGTDKHGNSYDKNLWLRTKLEESREKFRCDETTAKFTAHIEGRIVANLTFGIWAELMDSRFEPSLWTLALHKAFSSGVSRQEVHSRLRTLNDFRNRIAHHEPNLSRANKAHRDLFWLLSVLDRDIQGHVRSHSEVALLLSSRP